MINEDVCNLCGGIGSIDRGEGDEICPDCEEESRLVKISSLSSVYTFPSERMTIPTGYLSKL